MHAIGQNSPFASFVNRITVTLEHSVQLSGSHGAEMTLTGLFAGNRPKP